MQFLLLIYIDDQLVSQLAPAPFDEHMKQCAVVDGPFTETKEMLAGFNLIEADSMEAAVKMAGEFPWTQYGSIEVRPVRDVDAVRRRVGAAAP